MTAGQRTSSSTGPSAGSIDPSSIDPSGPQAAAPRVAQAGSTRTGVLPSGVLQSCVLEDGRQSQVAAEIARGAARLLLAHGLASLPEVTLANGRRADLLAAGGAGEIWIVEVKSCLEDFRSDQKWPEYRDYCDRMLFAVAPAFPADVLPEDAGLIVADRYGGELIRPAPEHKLSASRRKMVTLAMARVASARLQGLADPDLRIEAGWL